MVKNTPENTVRIELDAVTLEGALEVPRDAKGLVLFAHGSGSSRHSPRNNFVARSLRDAGLGTLLVDLLTETEDAVYENRFNIDLLTHRLLLVTQWLKKRPDTTGLHIGCFGASTGAAAALKAAAAEPDVMAVVSRGGRPDLAIPEVKDVHAPTLLIVGGEDDVVIELNQQAYEMLDTKKEFVIIPGATHLFEEPGALEQVAILAADWFTDNLVKTAQPTEEPALR